LVCCVGLAAALQFFDILKTKNSLPDGTTPLPDVPPSLADKLAAATAAASSNGHNGSSSHSSISHAAAAAAAAARGSSTDKQSLVEAALLLDQQQHPQQPRLLQQQHHNLGSASADLEYGMYGTAPDPTLSISGLGLEVELDDVVFGYHPERQVGSRSVSLYSNTSARSRLHTSTSVVDSCKPG
jgi:hypothetical protein